MTDVHAAIAGMIATRYSGEPTQRDLDVANIAYQAGVAAERERIVDLARDAWLAELLDGDTDGH